MQFKINVIHKKQKLNTKQPPNMYTHLKRKKKKKTIMLCDPQIILYSQEMN